MFFLHGQRSVAEPGPTPSPWSIDTLFLVFDRLRAVLTCIDYLYAGLGIHSTVLRKIENFHKRLWKCWKFNRRFPQYDTVRLAEISSISKNSPRQCLCFCAFSQVLDQKHGKLIVPIFSFIQLMLIVKGINAFFSLDYWRKMLKVKTHLVLSMHLLCP